MAMGYDKSKFKFSETFNNSDGKTSGSGFIGVIMGLTTVLGIISTVVGWWLQKPQSLEMMGYLLQLGLLSAALLGVRKVSGVFTNSKNKTGIEGESGEGEGEEAKKADQVVDKQPG